jgi:hypothetical protein
VPSEEFVRIDPDVRVPGQECVADDDSAVLVARLDD